MSVALPHAGGMFPRRGAGWMVVVVKQIESQLSAISASSPFAKTLITRLGGGDASFNASFLSAMFVLLPLLLMAFAVTQVNRWTADEEEGRLELVLSTPQPRLRVLFGRFAALGTATVIIGVLTLAVCAVAAAASGLKLDPGNLAAATLGMIPLGLLVAAIGYLASGWLRTSVDTGLVSFLLVIWVLRQLQRPRAELARCDTAAHCSLLLRHPLIHGLQLANMLGLVAVAVLALPVGSLRFARKDIGR